MASRHQQLRLLITIAFQLITCFIITTAITPVLQEITDECIDAHLSFRKAWGIRLAKIERYTNAQTQLKLLLEKVCDRKTFVLENTTAPINLANWKLGPKKDCREAVRFWGRRENAEAAREYLATKDGLLKFDRNKFFAKHGESPASKESARTILANLTRFVRIVNNEESMHIQCFYTAECGGITGCVYMGYTVRNLETTPLPLSAAHFNTVLESMKSSSIGPQQAPSSEQLKTRTSNVTPATPTGIKTIPGSVTPLGSTTEDQSVQRSSATPSNAEPPSSKSTTDKTETKPDSGEEKEDATAAKPDSVSAAGGAVSSTKAPILVLISTLILTLLS